MESPTVVQTAVHFSHSFTYLRSSVYYYQRRVPKDLRDEYRRPMIQMSLRTKCSKTALRAARAVTARLESMWAEMRLKRLERPAEHLLVSHNKMEEQIPTLSDALQLYLKLKGKDKGAVFHRTSGRSIGLLVKHAGDLRIDKYSRADANGLRDALTKQGLAPQSIKRMMSVIKTTINVAISEYGLNFPNVFAKIEYGQITPVNKRIPIPAGDIATIQQKCRSMNDDVRHLVALISDTGMRLSEAAGLLISDIKLDATVPHIDLRPHAWRQLKTDGSVRKIPLVGASLWAAQQLVAQTDSKFAVPRYTDEQRCNANSASATINKWLKAYVSKGCVVHSFRHSMRDRCRAVQCPPDIVDQIGGWKTVGVGQTYGDGYPLEVLKAWLEKVTL